MRVIRILNELKPKGYDVFIFNKNVLLAFRVVATNWTIVIDVNSPMVESGFSRKFVVVHQSYEEFDFI